MHTNRKHRAVVGRIVQCRVVVVHCSLFSRACTVPLRVDATALSEAGPHRDVNEDALGGFAPDEHTRALHKGYLYVIADGLGGHRAGEVASGLAVATLRDEYYSPTGHSRIEPSLRQAMTAANLRVHMSGQQHAEYRSMETTLTAVALTGNGAYVAHIGDSRAYLWREGRLTQLTTDHSEAAELVRMRILKPDKARDHPGRSVLTRSLGHQLIARPDFLRQPIASGDRLLLCTDGVWSEVEDDELGDRVGALTPAEACRDIMNLVLARGCPDNASLQVVHVIESVPSEDPRLMRAGWLSRIWHKGPPSDD